MNFIQLLLIGGLLLTGANLRAIESIETLSQLKLVGLIHDEKSPLSKTVLVIKDLSTQSTYTLMGDQTIPGSSYQLVNIEKAAIQVSDGQYVYRITRLEASSPKLAEEEPMVVESYGEDTVEAGLVSEKAQDVWERLRKKALTEDLKVFYPEGYEEKGQKLSKTDACLDGEDCQLAEEKHEIRKEATVDGDESLDQGAEY